MINVIVNEKNVQVKEGTRVLDLLKDEDKTKYMVCKLGTQVKELNRKLSDKDEGKKI